MLDIYGGDASTFGTGGAIWSSKMEINLTGPDATSSGTMYRGAITLGDMMRKSPSIAELIKISSSSRKATRTVTL